VRTLDARRAEAAEIAVEEQRARGKPEIPLGRYGEPTQFGRVAAFLPSPAVSHLAGTTVQVDGGLITPIP
jgi:3-oxoacyl-[acyl-carrier protein] reductase